MIHTASLEWPTFDRPPAERVHVAKALRMAHGVVLPEDSNPDLRGATDGRIGWATIVAFINWGRWMVQCPSCTSAQVGDPDDPRFFCYECRNSDHDCRWVRVQYPKPEFRELAWEILRRRAEPERNWEVWETLGDLADENVAHGLKIPELTKAQRNMGAGVPKDAFKELQTMKKQLTQNRSLLTLPGEPRGRRR